MSASYSQDDEREADTFGVAISWRAGFDPMRGVDFFTREAKDQDKERAERDAQLDEYRKEVVRLQTECTEYRRQWDNWTLFHTQENAKKVNYACNAASQHANAYNAALAQTKLEDSQGSLEQVLSSHPMAQDRIAAVAALTDYYKGARPLESLASYEQPYRVMTALVQSQSILVQPRAEVEMETAKTAAMPHVSSAPETKSSIADRLRQLEELHKSGLVNDTEYEVKRKSLLSEL